MSQNLQNFVKYKKIQLENLVDFEKNLPDSQAKLSCKNRSRYSRKRATFCRHFAEIFELSRAAGAFGGAPPRRACRGRAPVPAGLRIMHFSKIHFSKMHFSKMHFSKMHFSKMHFSKMIENAFFENFANFWRARSRLYRNQILQLVFKFAAFFKFYKICTLLDCSTPSIL